MHILVLPSWYPTTEAPQTGIYFAEQAQLLSESGLQVGVVYPEQQSLRRLSWWALRHKHFQTAWTNEEGLPTLRRYGWNVWWRFPAGLRHRIQSALDLTRRYIQRYGEPDLIHAHSTHWAGAAAASIRNEWSLPYVLTEHYSGFQEKNGILSGRWSLIERGFRKACGVAAVSTALRKAIVSHGVASTAEIEIHPNPVRASLFTLPPEERSAPPPFRVVTVANLNEQKGISDLITAFAKTGMGSSFSLHIIGRGPQRSLLEQQARRLGIAGQTYFHGVQDRETVRNALWDAHALVLPSRHETFGVVLIEALATGLPVIATRSGGPEEIVTPTTGLLVSPRAPAILADALCTLRRTWDTYQAPIIRSHTLNRFGPIPFLRRTKTFYRDALQE